MQWRSYLRNVISIGQLSTASSPINDSSSEMHRKSSRNPGGAAACIKPISAYGDCSFDTRVERTMPKAEPSAARSKASSAKTATQVRYDAAVAECVKLNPLDEWP